MNVLFKKGGNKEKDNVLDKKIVGTISTKSFYNIILRSPEKVKNVISKVAKLLVDYKKLGYLCELIASPQDRNGNYWSDYPSDYMSDKYGDVWSDKQYFCAIVYLNRDKTINVNRPIIIEYDINFTKIEKLKLIDKLDTYLKNHYEWNGKNVYSIVIYYDKVKNVLNKKTLEDDDFYPTLYIDIIVKNGMDLNGKDDKFLDKIDKKIRQLLKINKNSESYFMEYSFDSIELKIYTYPLGKYNRLINKLEEYLKNNDNIKEYAIDYYLNENKKLKI